LPGKRLRGLLQRPGATRGGRIPGAWPPGPDRPGRMSLHTQPCSRSLRVSPRQEAGLPWLAAFSGKKAGLDRPCPGFILAPGHKKAPAGREDKAFPRAAGARFRTCLHAGSPTPPGQAGWGSRRRDWPGPGGLRRQAASPAFRNQARPPLQGRPALPRETGGFRFRLTPFNAKRGTSLGKARGLLYKWNCIRSWRPGMPGRRPGRGLTSSPNPFSSETCPEPPGLWKILNRHSPSVTRC
jgi:hypothetical protein